MTVQPTVYLVYEEHVTGNVFYDEMRDCFSSRTSAQNYINVHFPKGFRRYGHVGVKIVAVRVND